MPQVIDASILKEFPHAYYHPTLRLVTWHPQGRLDDVLADNIIDFIESEERIVDAPFDRYADLNGLTEVRLKFGHAFRISERRRANYEGAYIKTAIVCSWPIGFGLARMYEALMEKALIHVRAFRDRTAAANWLDVPEDALCPPPATQTDFTTDLLNPAP